MFIKTGTKHASKDEIELAVFEAFWEFLLAVLVLGLRLAGTAPCTPRWVLPRSHRDLRRTQTGTQ